MISIPLTVGDLILTGKFKNKKVTVKEIGVDEFGSPTVNGRSILKIRIPKLYQKVNEMTLSEDCKLVKIKKTDKVYNYYEVRDDEVDDQPLNTLPFETKEQAEHSAMMKGYEIDGYEVEVPERKQPKVTPHEPTKYDKPKTIKEFNELLRRVVLEEYQRLQELDFDDDSEMGQKLKQYARLSDEIDRAKATLKALEAQFNPLDDEFVALIDAMTETQERVLRTKQILVTIKKKGYESKTPKYKQAFEFTYSKLNGQLKKMADDCLKAATETKRVSSSLAVQKLKSESVINEANPLSAIWGKIKNYFTKLTNKIKSQGQQVDVEIDKLERLANMK